MCQSETAQIDKSIRSISKKRIFLLPPDGNDWNGSGRSDHGAIDNRQRNFVTSDSAVRAAVGHVFRISKNLSSTVDVAHGRHLALASLRSSSMVVHDGPVQGTVVFQADGTAAGAALDDGGEGSSIFLVEIGVQDRVDARV